MTMLYLATPDSLTELRLSREEGAEELVTDLNEVMGDNLPGAIRHFGDTFVQVLHHALTRQGEVPGQVFRARIGVDVHFERNQPVLGHVPPLPYSGGESN